MDRADGGRVTSLRTADPAGRGGCTAWIDQRKPTTMLICMKGKRASFDEWHQNTQSS